MKLTKNMKNYEPLSIPIVKLPIEFSKTETIEYFNWFLAHIDERADYLRGKVSAELGVTIDQLDFSLDSLILIWTWFLQVAEVTDKSKEALKQLRKALKDEPQSVINYMLAEEKYELSVYTEYVLRDIGMYLSKIFIPNFPVLKWTIKTKPKNYVHVNQPLIIGFIDDNPIYPKPFYPDLEPIDLARTSAMCLLRDIKPNEKDLYNVCMQYVQWIPKEKNKCTE